MKKKKNKIKKRYTSISFQTRKISKILFLLLQEFPLLLIPSKSTTSLTLSTLQKSSNLAKKKFDKVVEGGWEVRGGGGVTRWGQRCRQGRREWRCCWRPWCLEVRPQLQYRLIRNVHSVYARGPHIQMVGLGRCLGNSIV